MVACAVTVDPALTRGELGQISKWLTAFVNHFRVTRVETKAYCTRWERIASGQFVDNLCAIRPRANFKKLDGFFVKLLRGDRVETTGSLQWSERVKRDNVFANRPNDPIFR
jgi:hypothetical protein